MTSGFSKLTQRQQEQLLIHLLQKWLVKLNPGLDAKFFPQNFLPLVAKAMSVLHACQKDLYRCSMLWRTMPWRCWS
jgi:hypothetical protein